MFTFVNCLERNYCYKQKIMKKLFTLFIIAACALMVVSCKNGKGQNQDADAQEEVCEGTCEKCKDGKCEIEGECAEHDVLSKLDGIASEAETSLAGELKSKGIFTEAAVEVKPVFEGGDASSFQQWCQKNAQYPEVAKENNESGKVLVNFTVGKDGKISDVKVLRGVSESLDAEAVRVVSSAPDWTPAQVGGKPVAVNYTMPVDFKLI